MSVTDLRDQTVFGDNIETLLVRNNQKCHQHFPVKKFETYLVSSKMDPRFLSVIVDFLFPKVPNNLPG